MCYLFHCCASYVCQVLQLVGIWEIYYAAKVAQCAQNPEVKGLTHDDFEILRIKCTEVTTVSSQGHETSWITWPFDSPYTISYRWSTRIDTLSKTDFEILKFKCIEVTKVTFQDHVTSLITWPFNSHCVIFYRWFVDTFFVSSTVTKIFWSTCPILSQACIFPLKFAWHEFWVVEGHKGVYHFSTFRG